MTKQALMPRAWWHDSWEAWFKANEGRADDEDAYERAEVLYAHHPHRLAADVAIEYYEAMPPREGAHPTLLRTPSWTPGFDLEIPLLLSPEAYELITHGDRGKVVETRHRQGGLRRHRARRRVDVAGPF